MSAAWFCPACQKHHAPHVETCPGPGTQTATAVRPPLGVNVWPIKVVGPSFAAERCPKCGMSFDGPMGYVCPNADCPTQARPTCTSAVIMSRTETASGIVS